MDEDSLGATIRYNAHLLDKIIKMKWIKGRGDRYKQRLERALMVWRKEGLEISEDISWAETTLEKIDEWNRQKKPIFPKRKRSKIMDIYDVIKQRRSVRCFEERDVEKENIEKVLEAGMWAPSSGNRQTWKFIVKKRVQGEKAAKGELSFKEGKWRRGSVLIYVAIDTRLYGEKEKFAGAMDAAAAIQNMLLMAHYLGLGGCWSYMADLINQSELRKQLGLDDYYYVYSAILLGYPLDFSEAPGRKPLDKAAKFIDL